MPKEMQNIADNGIHKNSGATNSSLCGALGQLESVEAQGAQLSLGEAEYRRAILQDIERRIAEDGPHRAQAHPARAKQFMPFSALRGFDDLISDRRFKAQSAFEDEL